MNRNKKTIRLTESDLHNIIKESVNKILSERLHTIKPHSQEYYDIYNHETGSDDGADYEYDSDTYKTMYDYDKSMLSTCDDDNMKEPKAYGSYKQYMQNRNGVNKNFDMKRAWDENDKAIANQRSEAEYMQRKRSQFEPRQRDYEGEKFRNQYVNSQYEDWEDINGNDDVSRALKQNRKDRVDNAKAKRANRKEIRNIGNDKSLHRKGSLNRKL